MTDPATAPPVDTRYRRAIMSVSTDIIHQLLMLPPDVHVHHFALGQSGFTIEVAVTSPDLPECAPGYAAPSLNPSYALIGGRAALVDTGISAVPNAKRYEWAYRYPDTGPVGVPPIAEHEARTAAAKDLSVILLRREPGQTEWTEAPA